MDVPPGEVLRSGILARPGVRLVQLLDGHAPVLRLDGTAAPRRERAVRVLQFFDEVALDSAG